MKTLIVSLAALAAVSSAALAAGGDAFRDSDAHFGKSSAQATGYATDSNALIINGSKKKTTFERRDETSEGNEHGAEDNGRDHARAPKV